MANLINYVAVSGDHVFFGMAEDPAAQVAGLQAGNPNKIELVGGWELPPAMRAVVLSEVQLALRKVPHRQGWYQTDALSAVETLAGYAKAAGGRRWQVRKRPVTQVKEHPRSRALVTPYGRYASAAAAADALGMSRQAAWERASRRSDGWRFADDDSAAPPPPRRGRPPKEKSLAP